MGPVPGSNHVGPTPLTAPWTNSTGMRAATSRGRKATASTRPVSGSGASSCHAGARNSRTAFCCSATASSAPSREKSAERSRHRW